MITFNASLPELKQIVQIVDRAERSNIAYATRQDMIMDLEACHCNGTPLQLTELLHSKLIDFSHDIYGIAQHLDRETGKLYGGFLPRCAISQ